MKHLLRVALGIAALSSAVLVPCPVFAQMTLDKDVVEENPPWYVGAGVGIIKFEGDEATKSGLLLNLRLGYDYSPRWSFEGVFNLAPHLGSNDVYNFDSGADPRPGMDEESCVGIGLAFDTLMHLYITPDRRIDPFLLGGVGFMYYTADRPTRINPDPTLRFGVGVAYHITPAWAVRADAIGAMTIDKTEFNFMPAAVVTYKWGTDVPRSLQAAGGLTDTDGDGLPDAEELRLKTDPRNPDTDGDGLLDGEEVYKYKTDPLNPDSDYDGLTDGQEVYVHKTEPNIRDTDNGGVADGHEVIEDGTNPLDPSDDLLLFTLEIEFETDKAVIRPAYFGDLDKIAKVLVRDPKSTARIEGHADKRKTSVADYNLQLSERRAKAVLDHLADKHGIARSRLNSLGYGFNRPVAPNDPVLGNKKNRRVEVYIRRGGVPVPPVGKMPAAPMPAR